MSRNERMVDRRVRRRAASVFVTLMVAAAPLLVASAGQASAGALQASARGAVRSAGLGAAVLPMAGVPARTSGMLAVAPSATSASAGRSPAGGAAPVGSQLSNAQVTAHDNAFWQGSTKIVLHGANLAADRGGLESFKADANQVAGWGMNFVRLDVHWASVELVPPLWVNGTWVHTYDPKAMQRIVDDVDAIAALGMVVDINNTHDGSFWGYPTWLYTSSYNSHHITYPLTQAGSDQAATDFWSDQMRQRLMSDWLTQLVSRVKSHSRVMGYEVLNEPNQGLLPATLATSQMIVDWQLGAAKLIRSVDPNRVVVFTTRSGFAPSLWPIDLSGWVNPASLPQPMGSPDIAVDAHDYFGGRWGTGLVKLPGDPSDQQAYEDVYAHVLTDGTGTYIGTTQGQMGWVRDKMDALRSWGVPMFVGEFGDYADDPGVTLFFGTTTSAFAYTNVSWAVSRGNLGITDGAGNLQPYGQIVVDAARNYP